jgi:hypothetical protein
MSSIDNRIVSMKFDNAGFDQKATATMGVLDKLKASLKFPGASKGLEEVSAAASKVDLGHINGAVTGVSKSFLAMSTVAITALSSITSKAIGVGAQVAKSLTVDPIKTGFEEYEQKLGAIQTIMAGSGENLKTVNKALQELNTYSDKTIYSFADMTQNIGKFTNAGISLKGSVASIKGIANVAALSGANAEEASRAMYNFAQAISSGSIRLADWKSIELANLATKEFKQQLIDSAVAAGTLTKAGDGLYKTLKGHTVSATKGFNESLSDQWLTTEALNTTLARYADETTSIGKRATAAAQDVKTFSQLMDTLKESVGSGWAQTWEIVFGNFNQAKSLFTGINNVLGGAIAASAAARNKVLSDWSKAGGRAALFEGLSNTFKALMSVVKPIKDAFRDIFPPTTGKRLAEVTKAFRDFTARLTISSEASENLKRTFRGVFAIFSIAKQIIGGIAGVIFKLVGSLSSGTGGILKFTGGLGDFLVSIDTALKKGGLLTKFFTTVGNAVAIPVKFLGQLTTALASFISDNTPGFVARLSEEFNKLGPTIDKIRGILQNLSNAVSSFFDTLTGKSTQASSGVDQVKTSLAEVPSILDQIKSAWANIQNAFKRVGDFLAPVWDSLKNVFTGLKDKLLEFVSDMGIQDALALVNTAFFIALYRMIRSFVKEMKGLVSSMSGTFDNVSNVLEQVTSNLKTMQSDIRADIILKIAAALALLAASIWVLSKIDPKSLAISIGALAIMLKLVVGAMDSLEAAASKSNLKTAARMAVMSVALIGLGIAILALASAVAILGRMKTATLVKGLSAVAAIIGGIIIAVNFLQATGGATQLLIASAALLVLSGALIAFSGALALYSKLNVGTIVDGGAKIVAVLAAIGLTMKLMPKNMLASSVALFIVANALVVLAGALKILGGMSVEEMGKSLIMLGGALLIITAALNALDGAVAGAAAILLFAAALTILVPPLLVLSRMSLKQIGIALLALAGVFTVLGIAAFVLAPLVPVIQALAGAIALLGLGIALVGGGLLAFATGLGILAASGAAGAAVLVGAIITIAETIPLLAQQFGLGLIAFAKVISGAGPVLVKAIQTLLASLLDALIGVLPKVGEFAVKLIDTILNVLVISIPKIVKAGIAILLGFLTGIKQNIGKVVRLGGDIIAAYINGIANNLSKIIRAGTNLIVKFINGISNAYDRIITAGVNAAKKLIKGIGEKAGELVDAGFDAIISFIRGVTKAINNRSGELRSAGKDLAAAIIRGMVGGLADGLSSVVSAAVNVVRNAWQAAKNFLKSHSPSKRFFELGKFSALGLANGLSAYASNAAKSAGDVAKAALNKVKDSLAGIGSLIDEVDTTPVIAPVIDLTQFKKDAAKIQPLLETNPLTAKISTDAAQALSLSVAKTKEEVTTPTTPEIKEIKFEQNNYSPTSLSAIEIYRNTRSQLALAKGALTAS